MRRILGVVLLAWAAVARGQVLECTECVPGQALQQDAVGPDHVLSAGQTDGYCLKYQATGDTWQWGACGGFETREDGQSVPGGNPTTVYDLSTASFDAACTNGTCVLATGTDVLLDGSGKIGQANDFAVTVDLATKKLLLPNGTASPSSSCTTGEIYIDSDADPFAALTYCKTTNTQLPIAPRIGTWTGGWHTTGGTGLAADNTTRYLYVWQVVAGGTTEANVDAPSSITGKVWGLSVGLSTAPGAGKSRTITLRKAAASTALACTVADTAKGCTVLLTTPVTVAAGDLLNVMAAAAGTPAATDVTYTILWTANAF